MEQLSSYNKLLVLEWGTYVFVGVFAMIYFIYKNKSSQNSVKLTAFIKASGKDIDLSSLLLTLLLSLVIFFIILLLYRNQRTPTLETFLPTLVLMSPVIILLIATIVEKGRGGDQ